METLFLSVALLGAGAEPAPQFTVVNKCPPTFTVTNRMPAPAAPTLTTRGPIGHTHTCANGHTWDHAANPSHTCQFCGLSQFIQDPVARPVTIVAANPVPSAPLQTYTLPSATYGGCVGSNCTVPQSRPVLFPRLRGW